MNFNRTFRFARWRPTPIKLSLLAAVLVMLTVLSCSSATAEAAPAQRPPRNSSQRVWPLIGSVVVDFDLPTSDWLPGHRGVDIAGMADDPVRAAAAGTVAWAGQINGVAMMSVQHANGLRTTYQPVTAWLVPGTPVAAGDPIGWLQSGHCLDSACLHLGLKRDERYLDPLAWLIGDVGPIQLLPTQVDIRPTGVQLNSGVGKISPATGQTFATGARQWPVTGAITSAFGLRRHPILGIMKMHSGVDVGASCLTPVLASETGEVTSVSRNAAQGNVVVLASGTEPGLRFTYAHLHDRAFGLVRVGQRVQAGQTIGLVGTTGQSTGCHLHFATHRNGQAVNPLGVVPRG